MEDTAINNTSKISVKVITIIIFIVFTQAVSGFYATYDMTPPGAFVLMSMIGLLWLGGDWFMKDSKKFNIDWAFDMGFFLYIFWPIFIPYYLFKTRGLKKAALTTLSFVSLYLGTYFVSCLVTYYFLP